MATKNIVPNADTEGQLGTSTKGWGKIFLGGDAANIDVNNVSGTNTAGKSLTLISGASTGSGAGGSIVFQTAAAGGSGTSVNSHATVLTLDSAKLATFTGGLDIAGAVDIAGDLTLSAGADGALNFSAASSIKILDNSATSLVIEEADTAYMTFVTTNSSEAIKFDKALDINAAVQLDSTLTVGVNDTGYDVKFFGATSGKSLLWDESADSLIVTGTTDLIGTTNLDIVDIDGAVNIGAEVTLAAANKIIFNDASQFIHASSNAILNLGATDEIDLTATVIDVNGTMDVSGNATFGGKISVNTGNAVLSNFGSTSIGTTNTNYTGISLGYSEPASYTKTAIVQEQIGDGAARGHLHFLVDTSNDGNNATLADSKMNIHGTTGDVNITGGLLTIADDLIIKTGGTIGGASDPDLLTLADQSLTVAGKIKAISNTTSAHPATVSLGIAANGTGGGNRQFDASFSDETTSSFTGTDSADQGYGYFAATIVSGRNYTILFKSIVSNGTLGTIITSNGLNFATDIVQSLTLPPVAVYNTVTFTASANATHLGFAGYRTGGTMSLAISDVVLFEGIADVNVGMLTANSTLLGNPTFSGKTTFVNNTHNQITIKDVNASITLGAEDGVVAGLGFSEDADKQWFLGPHQPGSTGFTTDFRISQRDGGSWTNRVRIATGGDVTLGTGNLVIGTAGKGIDFSATSDGGVSTPSELLDDYEEGTWTGTMSGDGVGNTATGTYVRIGDLVYIQIYFAAKNINSAGNAIITGVPFSANVTSSLGYSVISYIHGTSILNCKGGYVAATAIYNTIDNSTNQSTWVTGIGKSGMWGGTYRIN